MSRSIKPTNSDNVAPRPNGDVIAPHPATPNPKEDFEVNRGRLSRAIEHAERAAYEKRVPPPAPPVVKRPASPAVTQKSGTPEQQGATPDATRQAVDKPALARPPAAPANPAAPTQAAGKPKPTYDDVLTAEEREWQVNKRVGDVYLDLPAGQIVIKRKRGLIQVPLARLETQAQFADWVLSVNARASPFTVHNFLEVLKRYLHDHGFSHPALYYRCCGAIYGKTQSESDALAAEQLGRDKAGTSPHPELKE